MQTMTFAQALNHAHKLEMQRDPQIYVAGEDVGTYGGIFGVTGGLLDEFGDKRVRDTPITESAIIGTAVGAAAGGLRPVIELMFVDFIGVALDQLYNQAAKMKYMFGGKAELPMVVRTSCGAGIGAAAQHTPFRELIVPCGISDAEVTSMREILGERAPETNDVVESVHRAVETGLGRPLAKTYNGKDWLSDA